MDTTPDITYRYERKYRVEGFTLPWVEQMIRSHPAFFRRLHPSRTINNVYFDTPDFSAYRLNVIGAPQRRKYRLRWYGTDTGHLRQPVLEVKIKNAELGYKKNYPQPDLDWQDTPALWESIPILKQQGLQAVMVNTYQRAYWASPGGRFRLTIDSGLQFAYYSPEHLPRFTAVDTALIVELKYADGDDTAAQNIFNALPFRQTKYSKYVSGVNALFY